VSPYRVEPPREADAPEPPAAAPRESDPDIDSVMWAVRVDVSSDSARADARSAVAVAAGVVAGLMGVLVALVGLR
jgi:hypothetical protein